MRKSEIKSVTPIFTERDGSGSVRGCVHVADQK